MPARHFAAAKIWARTAGGAWRRNAAPCMRVPPSCMAAHFHGIVSAALPLSCGVAPRASTLRSVSWRRREGRGERHAGLLASRPSVLRRRLCGGWRAAGDIRGVVSRLSPLRAIVKLNGKIRYLLSRLTEKRRRLLPPSRHDAAFLPPLRAHTALPVHVSSMRRGAKRAIFWCAPSFKHTGLPNKHRKKKNCVCSKSTPRYLALCCDAQWLPSPPQKKKKKKKRGACI